MIDRSGRRYACHEGVMAATRFSLATLLLLGFLGLSLPAQALTIRQVEVVGANRKALNDALVTNLRAGLEVTRIAPTKSVSEARLAYLLRRIPAQVSDALEPFGYYHADATVTQRRDGTRVRLRIEVSLGDPVRVTQLAAELIGPASSDVALRPVLKAFAPKLGAVFDHAAYEVSKANVARGLAARGYFRARNERARVEVERATRSARIDVAWRSGPRHAFGETRFEGSQLRPGLLEPLLPYRPGQPYSQADLLAFNRALVELDYFALVDIQPERRGRRGERQGELTPPDLGQRGVGQEEEADEPEDDTAEPPRVPITISLTPAKRTRYRAGVSYGSDNGAALRLGLDRRWVNARGHKLKADAELGQQRSQIGLGYRIPEFVTLPGWWNFSVNLREEAFGRRRSEIGALSAARTARWRGVDLTIDTTVQYERFETLDLLRREDRDALLVYPGLRMDRVVTDDPLYPERGYGLGAYVRVGTTALGSDIDFAQAGVDLRWLRALGEDWRVLLRGQLASTWTDNFDQLPPSLRNFAGGDRSVRGYAYQELAPLNALGEPVGGEHLAVASAELERRINASWGVAGFVDAGDAFSGGDFTPAVGVGLGLRWRSPVGPVRIDIAHGLGGQRSDAPNQSIRLHIGIGPEL